MRVRMETASGYRLFATPITWRLGKWGSLQFMDPTTVDYSKNVELVFESRTVAKYYKLHNRSLHEVLTRQNIVSNSIFLLDITNQPIKAIVIKKDQVSEDIFLEPGSIISIDLEAMIISL